LNPNRSSLDLEKKMEPFLGLRWNLSGGALRRDVRIG